MHDAAFKFVAHIVGCSPMIGSVLEFGSHEWNGSVREIFTHVSKYIGIDLVPGPGVDVVCDATTYISRLNDCVVCCEVFEHTQLWPGLIKNAAHSLRSGGLFIATCASHLRLSHSSDGGELKPEEYYYGLTREELDAELRKHFSYWYVDAVTNSEDLHCFAVKGFTSVRSLALAAEPV